MENTAFFDKTDELLVKYLTGAATETERIDALSWIETNDENKRYFNELKDVYEAAKLTQPASEYNTDLTWEKVKSRHYKRLVITLREDEVKKRRQFIKELMKYAAIFVVALSLGVAGYLSLNRNTNNSSKIVWNTIEAPFGSRAHLTLADGTKVWLNAGSQLRYSSNFSSQNREIFLEGEAYFDVTPNKKMQFIVRTSHLDVKVFGTEFNVKAYPDENIIQTTLVRGSVILEGDIIAKNGKGIVLLKPNQTATYFIHPQVSDKMSNKSGDQIERKIAGNENLEIIPVVNPIVYTSWKDSKWIIEGETLSDLAKKLERRFNMKFIFQSNTLQDYRFTGTLKEETLEQVLNLIKLSAPIDYMIQNNEVYLNENKSFKNSYDELLLKK
jgi:transmembrane sensor